jgi:quercetin dioxygenase-like cupin family protein
MKEISDFYPKMIKELPEIDVNLQGVKGWLVQSSQRQVVLFEIKPIGKIPDHSHGAQWGIMLDGRMNLTIAGKTRLYEKGDRYFIPSGTVHSAEFLTTVRVIDFFEDNDRYNVKDDQHAE